MPVYQHATYAGETITLMNPSIRLDIHKRVTGWGWVEIFTPQGKCMGILDHLGELLLRDQEIPMRLQADSAVREEVIADKDHPVGQRLVFQVKSLILKEKLKNSSFEPWMNYPLDIHCMVGEVSLTLAPDRPVFTLKYRLVSKANQYARYVRGPWLKVGEGVFGAAKDDAILPGVEWLEGEEWSSGTDWFKDPWAMRWIPHPNKVAIPVMAVSHGGVGIGLAWNPKQHSSGWFNYHRNLPQPLFASPNFIDRQNNHLLGLMVPDVEIEAQENQVYREPPLELHLEQRVEFDAEIFLVEGNSLDVVVDWVRRHGMPEPPEPRWPFPEALERIAQAYNHTYWHEGRGFGVEQHPNSAHPVVPRFAEWFIQEHPESGLAKELQAKVEWCREKNPPKEPSMDELEQRGREIVSWQREDGSFPFDPKGRHYRKDDFVVATTYLEPMGLEGDTALDITILPAMELLEIILKVTGNPSDPACGQRSSVREAARKALDYCLDMKRPEGGDFWETPLHAPNLFAAGHAAIAYALGYRVFADEKYLKRAVHWIRALLPFTHLWQPADKAMMYNTKPCLCSSDWFFANWVRDHVQWEVLETFAISHRLAIRWDEIDPEIDWKMYQRGITVAVMRWMLDHRIENWLPHNLPWTLELFREGKMDLCFADTHNTMTGNYGGAGIMPDIVAMNIYAALDDANLGSANSRSAN
jgi:hypothetical protein